MPRLKPFAVNRYGRLVFPGNFVPELDLSIIPGWNQFDASLTRDFGAKAPTASQLLATSEARGWETRYELLKDASLHLYWAERYALTLYEKRPMRWRDVPKRRDDLFVATFTPWPAAGDVWSAVADAYAALDPTFCAPTEDAIFTRLLQVGEHITYDPAKPPGLVPTSLSDVEDAHVITLGNDPDYMTFTDSEILDCHSETPELEALLRRSMVLHNQFPWDARAARLVPIAHVDADDLVLLYAPRSRDALALIRSAPAGGLRRPERSPVTVQAPRRHIAPTVVEQQFRVPAKIGSLAVVRGEHECSNDDIIRNTAYNWSAMTADDIARKTGILARRYTERDVRELARDAAVSAVEHAGLTPSDVGAVLVLSCTNPSPIPSAATWLSSELGIYQTRASHDVVAACAGFSYGLADAVRLIQEIDAPVLVVCAEKFSDKIGTVRTSRMIFGDAAAALVIAPASRDEPSDIEVLQTYASGPSNEVNSIVWPNPEFDDNLTIVGPDVRSLVARYLRQIVDELRSLPSPDGSPRTLFDDIELVVPHQANKTMVEELIAETGMSRERVFFNIERVGNVSAASIPVAIADAVHSGAIDRRMRVLTPGFGAGGVAGYAVLFLDPEIVAPEVLASHPGLHLERGCQ